MIIFLLLFPTTVYSAYDCTDADNCKVTCDAANDDADLTSAIAAANASATISISGACDFDTTATVTKALTLTGEPLLLYRRLLLRLLFPMVLIIGGFQI